MKYWRNLGIYSIEYFRVRKGEEAFAEALKLCPSDDRKAGVYAVMGNTFNHVALYDKAEASFKESLKLQQDQPWTWNNLSIVQRRSGNCEEAERSAEKALSLMSFGAARGNLLSAKVCAGKIGEAERLLDYADWADYVALGDYYFRRDDDRKAEAYYSKAVLEKPNSSRVAASMVGLYIKGGRFVEALAVLEKVLRDDPYRADTLAKVAKVHVAKGDRRLGMEFAHKTLEAHYDTETVASLKQVFGNDPAFEDLLARTGTRVQALYEYFERKYDYQHLHRDSHTTLWIFSVIGSKHKDREGTPFLLPYAKESPFDEVRRQASEALTFLGAGSGTLAKP